MSRARVFFKRHPSVLAYVLIVGVTFGGFTKLQHETSDRQHAACLASVDGRTVLRTVIEKSFSNTGVGDLTKIPGFADLDAPTQTYFRNLVALQQAGGGSAALKQALLDKVPIPKC